MIHLHIYYSVFYSEKFVQYKKLSCLHLICSFWWSSTKIKVMNFETDYFSHFKQWLSWANNAPILTLKSFDIGMQMRWELLLVDFFSKTCPRFGCSVQPKMTRWYSQKRCKHNKCENISEKKLCRRFLFAVPTYFWIFWWFCLHSNCVTF